MNVSIRTDGLIELRAAFVRSGESWPKVSVDIATETTEVMQVAAVGAIRADGLVFRAELVNSIATQVISEGTPAAPRVIGHTYSELLHAEVMNDGRKPHPELNGKWHKALAPWVVKKIPYEGEKLSKYVKMSGVAKKGGKSQRAQAAIFRAQRFALSMAYVIARSIDRKGIVGRRFFEKAMAVGEAQLPAIADRALARYVEKF
jgi:hypothetical protein